jgi:hypothetical protein
MRVDAVLIDDDPWVSSDWQDQAKRHSKVILAVTSFEELSPLLASLDCNVPIFVDVELGGGQSGLEVARRLASFGMTRIFLATAHTSINVDSLSFLKGIVGKDPPGWLFSAGQSSKKLSKSERLILLSAMSAEQKALFDHRLCDYENALYGLEGSLWLDGIGTHYPEDVLDAWERGIYESCSDDELKKRIQEAWRESLAE